MKEYILLDNIDKEVFKVVQEIDKSNSSVMPSKICTILNKRPQAISRSLSKLKKSGMVEGSNLGDKRKIYYTVKASYKKQLKRGQNG